MYLDRYELSKRHGDELRADAARERLAGLSRRHQASLAAAAGRRGEAGSLSLGAVRRALGAFAGALATLAGRIDEPAKTECADCA